LGADGVMLLGCEPGKCHFDTDAECIAQEYEKTRGILGLLGLGERRLVLAHMPRGDGSGFVSRLVSFSAEIEQLRPATRAGA